MLHSIAPPPSADELVTDFSEVEFDLVNDKDGALYGRLELVKPSETMGALYQLGELLVAYCKSERDKRDPLARQIELQAQRLARVPMTKSATP